MPAWFPTAGRDLRLGQPLGDAIEGGGRGGIRIPGEDLGYHRGFHRIKPQALGIARAFGVQDIPIGSDGPGQQLATPSCGLAAAAHPIGDQGALILGHRASDLEQQLILEVLTHRAVQKLDLTAALGAFVE
jgi:acetyl-CoA acetyltransferase